MYYIVKYSGPFGFIKPWTAVRDEETFSQQFLTPSVINGIELKLFPEMKVPEEFGQKIVRHKLTYDNIDVQQENVHAKEFTKKNKIYFRERSILKRGVLINPRLTICFSNIADAKRAFEQHICLCRNEDILLPDEMNEIIETEFDGLDGFEFIESKNDESFLVGFNRLREGHPMYGVLGISGKPVGTKNE